MIIFDRGRYWQNVIPERKTFAKWIALKTPVIQESFYISPSTIAIRRNARMSTESHNQLITSIPGIYPRKLNTNSWPRHTKTIAYLDTTSTSKNFKYSTLTKTVLQTTQTTALFRTNSKDIYKTTNLNRWTTNSVTSKKTPAFQPTIHPSSSTVVPLESTQKLIIGNSNSLSTLLPTKFNSAITTDRTNIDETSVTSVTPSRSNNSSTKTTVFSTTHHPMTSKSDNGKNTKIGAKTSFSVSSPSFSISTSEHSTHLVTSTEKGNGYRGK